VSTRARLDGCGGEKILVAFTGTINVKPLSPEHYLEFKRQCLCRVKLRITIDSVSTSPHL
jgi:hypothetical protein